MAVFITSCNVQRFDILQFFKNENKVYWKQISKCSTGDTVYIYVGRPYSELMFKSVVLEINIENANCAYLPTDPNIKTKYMQIELLEKIEQHIGLEELLSNGLKTVQCATQASPELTKYIEKRIV